MISEDSDSRSKRLVISCKHVLNGIRPILLIMHFEDGEVAVTCGGHDHRNEDDYATIHYGHLVENDSTLSSLPTLPKKTAAERKSVGEEWLIHGELDRDF